MSNQDEGVAGPPQEVMEEHDKRVDLLISNLARANAGGIAACIAGGFQDVPITFPLGCFLLAALGYGLHLLSEVLLYPEVIVHYVRRGKPHVHELDASLAKKLPTDTDLLELKPKLTRVGLLLGIFGTHLLAAFFLIGVLGGFLIVAI